MTQLSDPFLRDPSPAMALSVGEKSNGWLTAATGLNPIHGFQVKSLFVGA